MQPDKDAGQREMIIHTLVPPFLQLAATESLMTATILEPKDEIEDDENTEDLDHKKLDLEEE